MKASTLELGKVKKYFVHHSISLVKVLVLLINCILLSGTCNLNKAKKKGSIVQGKQININSLYIRFIRFFKMKNPKLFVLGVLHLLVSLLSPYLSVQPYYVFSMDRTNWKLGNVNINILYIGIVLDNGCFIPIYFELLDKRGNSNQSERIDLTNTFKVLFPNINKKPIFIVGDREFIGKEWFDFLKTSEYEFVMRLRRTDYFNELAIQMNLSKVQLKNKIRGHVAQKGFFLHPIILKGKTYYYHVQALRGRKLVKKTELDVVKTKDDGLIRFLSTCDESKTVSLLYDKRWKIEVFFEDIKEKGFRLEQVNFTKTEKIRLMVAIVSVCYALCLTQGLIEYSKKKPRMKYDKKAQKYYPRVSIFSKGFEIVEQAVFNIKQLIKLIINALDEEWSINQMNLLKIDGAKF